MPVAHRTMWYAGRMIWYAGCILGSGQPPHRMNADRDKSEREGRRGREEDRRRKGGSRGEERREERRQAGEGREGEREGERERGHLSRVSVVLLVAPYAISVPFNP
eukprot:2293021-Rhodomonas_salina.1